MPLYVNGHILHNKWWSFSGFQASESYMDRLIFIMFKCTCIIHCSWSLGLIWGAKSGKKHLLFTYMAIICSLMGVIFYLIGTVTSVSKTHWHLINSSRGQLSLLSYNGPFTTKNLLSTDFQWSQLKLSWYCWGINYTSVQSINSLVRWRS